MGTKFVIRLDDMYVQSTGDGDIRYVASIKDATPLDSWEEAQATGPMVSKDGWSIIEVTPDLDPIH